MLGRLCKKICTVRWTKSELRDALIWAAGCFDGFVLSQVFSDDVGERLLDLSLEVLVWSPPSASSAVAYVTAARYWGTWAGRAWRYGNAFNLAAL